LGDLGVMYALNLKLVGKPVVDFLFVTIERFSLSLTVETLCTEILSKSAFLRRGVREGVSPNNHCWVQNSRA